MIKIENASVYGFEETIRGMRNPMNSWDKSDSKWHKDAELNLTPRFDVGANDLKLMQNLIKAGSGDHRKYLRMIIVYVDITAPLYWWKEADTYKVGTVANSCSTMHKIHAKEFTVDDFSHEKLFGCSMSILNKTVEMLNEYRDLFIKSNNKCYWWQMIQLLPSSYNQKRTVMLNYEVLRNMYHSRKNHKLDEWRDFCEFIKSLPYGEELIAFEN